MNAQRLLAVLAIVMGAVGITAATHLTGAFYGHDPRLGGADLSLLFPNAPRIYAPTAIFAWAWIAPLPWPLAFDIGFMGAVLSSTLAIGGYGVLLRQRWQQSRPAAETFGAEAWGTCKDAARAGLVMGKGHAPKASPHIITLGRLGGEFLTVTDGGHVAGFGSSGSGKTRTIMIPTLLSWGSSALIYTAGKLDVWEITSGFRAGFSDVLLLDLGNPDGWRFNPLAEVRLGTEYEVDDCRLIAGQFAPPANQIKGDPFWDNEGKKLLSAVILHVLCSFPAKERNLATVRKILYRPVEDIIVELLGSPRAYVTEVAGSTLVREERSRDSILGTAQSYLNAWASPVIAKVTSESDFRLSDLVCNPRPMSLYLRLASDMREEWRPVLKVLITQVVRSLLHEEQRMADGRIKKHKLGLFLDEFHSFGFPGWPEDLAEMRSYGGQAVMVTPSEKSLAGLYGPHQTISATCRVRLYLDAADPDTQQQVSRQLGTATAVREARSQNWHAGAWFPAQQGESQAEYTRELMDPGALRLLPREQMLLLATGCKPLQAAKLIDFPDREPFRSRLKQPALAKPIRDDPSAHPKSLLEV